MYTYTIIAVYFVYMHADILLPLIKIKLKRPHKERSEYVFSNIQMHG